MNSISQLIINSRKNKHLTQEQLADLAKVNLRTIQRIENNENTPRGNTLKLICDVLEIDVPNQEIEVERYKTNYLEKVLEYFFLLIINLTLMGIIGWMTLDTEANLNSRFAGFLLSFFIPIFIVYLTPKIEKTVRLFKFGSGFMLYLIFSVIIVGFPVTFVTGLLPCLVICLLTLFYGEIICKRKNVI